MNFLKYFLFAVILTQVASFEKQSRRLMNCELATKRTTTTLRPAVDRIFSRKKRFLLLPKGGALKFTLNVSKRLIAVVPRGFNFGIDAAVYYPGPTARIDLLPKRLRKPTTTTPKPTGTTEPIIVHIPGSLLRYKAKPAAKPAKVQRIGEGPVQWIDTQKYEKYTNPQKWSKYGSPGYAQKYEWTPAKAAQYKYPQASWNKWVTQKPVTSQQWGNQWKRPQQQQQRRQWWSPNATEYTEWPPRQRERWGRDVIEAETAEDHDHIPYNPIDFPDLEPFEDWKHYHTHRDRRQLFHQFEGLSRILRIDMKSCILRAICESKRFLLPPGYSMIQDILRLVFTFPTISGLSDEYSRAMQSDVATCEKYVRSQCAFSMLDWLLNPQKGVL